MNPFWLTILHSMRHYETLKLYVIVRRGKRFKFLQY